MGARRLDGIALATGIRQELKPRADAFTRAHRRPPRLGIVLAGAHPASEVYVRNKVKALQEHGCQADLLRVSADASLADVLAVVARLNNHAAVDGILVQSPLPAGMGQEAAQRVFDAIDPDKDVDGFHPLNAGLLSQDRAALVPCTPLACVELLERSDIAISGRHAVVIGRSNIVGKPLALLLLHSHATVTVCHSRTPDVARVAAEADLLIAAVGRAGFVTREFVKPGATVLDVGINAVTGREEAGRVLLPDSPRWRHFEEKGNVLVGDVHPSVEEVAGALTPVPGGIGPLTVTMVLRNTIVAAERRAERGQAPDWPH